MITHLACVMDGNRRWATRQGQLPWIGHKAGVKTVETVIKFCLHHKISYLSLYTFSLENFKRSEQEQSYLFNIVIQQAEGYVPQFIEQGVAIRFVGDISLFPQSVQDICHKVQEQTKAGEHLQVNFLFGYGARQEIFAATKKFAELVASGANLTQKDFESLLWTAGTPDPDLILRTGGVQRLSNFLLYQSAYTEIRFVDTLWPDLTESEIFDAVTSAVLAQKNIGK
ncbi:di-trans,poly-cis-decaprenylcistransferase [Candidatus Babeliales bacterium]|nr:di-trans,poly-cis-decaprenylcistransferase [Candidatus Babeliales bacterium]MBP9844208.1 di-trans,poly-cis-decaprenylcistransferase [Candidatus Babeliales bacterium]